MPELSRRHFLQAAGATLVAAGLHQTQLLRHQKVLAQPTPRKLALIIGINDYTDAPLFGCVNDAILQRQLLIHRFGFNPRDAVMLLNEDATRQGILDAVEEHLIKQAKPGDVAVLHFSGHGSLVRDPDPIYINPETGKGLAGTLVPVDGALPSDAETRGGTVADIMGHTLFLLMSAIQTENFTAVLDSCYSGASTREIRVRAREGGEGFNGFVAGAFSYRLTQYLWQQDSTPERAISEMQSQISRRGYRQQPKLEIEAGRNYGQQPLYNVQSSAFKDSAKAM